MGFGAWDMVMGYVGYEYIGYWASVRVGVMGYWASILVTGRVCWLLDEYVGYWASVRVGVMGDGLCRLRVYWLLGEYIGYWASILVIGRVCWLLGECTGGCYGLWVMGLW